MSHSTAVTKMSPEERKYNQTTQDFRYLLDRTQVNPQTRARITDDLKKSMKGLETKIENTKLNQTIKAFERELARQGK